MKEYGIPLNNLLQLEEKLIDSLRNFNFKLEQHCADVVFFKEKIELTEKELNDVKEQIKGRMK